jgi:hypothetical protein
VPNSDGSPEAGIGLAARVILHLSRLGRLGPNDVARAERTQQGMVLALQVPQSSLVMVLQPLLAADVLTVERRFISDFDRRMKVYCLSEIGESAAWDLQHPKVAKSTLNFEGDWVA